MSQSKPHVVLYCLLILQGLTGCHPLADAVKKNDYQKVQAILMEEEISKEDLDLATWRAVNRNYYDIASLILQHYPIRDRPEASYILIVAVRKGNEQMAVLLLDHGALPNVKDHHEAAQPLHFAFASANALEILSLLLSRGADPNAQTKAGLTPLHIAAASGRIYLIKPLLQAGADPNQSSKKGLTPLHAAAFGPAAVTRIEHEQEFKDDGSYSNIMVSRNRIYEYSDPNQIVFTILLDQNVDINAIDSWGWTPLHYAMAAEIPYLRRCVISNLEMRFTWCNRDPENDEDEDEDEDEESNIAKALLNEFVRELSDTLAEAMFDAILGEPELTESELIEHWAQILLPIPYDHLSYCLYDPPNSIKRIRPDVVRLLLKNGSNPNFADNLGNTPLHWAVLANRPDVVKILQEYGAHSGAWNDNDLSPFELAIQMERHECLAELE